MSNFIFFHFCWINVMGTEKLSILKYVLLTFFVCFSQAHFLCLSVCLSVCLSLCLSLSLSLSLSLLMSLSFNSTSPPPSYLLHHPSFLPSYLSVYLTARPLTPLSVSTVLSLSVYLFHPFPVSHSSVFLSPSANLSTKIFERFTSAEIRY